MKQVNWYMKESFVFPAEIGQPTKAEEIQVTPRFTAETVEGRPKLTGIYHLAVTVNLTGEKVESYDVGESVVIDDLDLNENNGYFEYALPFNIDFPPEAENPVDIETLNPSFEVQGHHLSVLWEVSCTYAEAGIAQENKKAQKVKEEAQEEVVVAKEEPVESKQEAQNSEEQEVQNQEESEATSKSAEVVVATSASTQDDEVLDFIAELEDGISATSFRLNDVLV